jgi:hypothetical protein
MHYRKLFENEFAGAWDLTDDDDRPIDKTVTIDRIGKTELPKRHGKGTETKPVLFFKNTSKGMVCNVTNCRAIANMYGPNVADWAGKRITLYSTEVDTPDGPKMAIRVRPTPPPAAAKANKKEKDRKPGDDE